MTCDNVPAAGWPVAPACERDLDALVDAYEVYLSGFKFPANRAKLRDLLQHLVTAEWASIWVCRAPTRLAGFVAACLAYSSVSACVALYVNDLYVTSDARRQGIAKRLISALEAGARRRGVGKLFLTATRGEVVVYRKFGFREDALTPTSMWKNLDV